MKISKGTIIRTVILVVALINSLLSDYGKSPLPISDNDVVKILTWCFTAAASITAWWKNNSFTKNAILSDKYKKELEEGDKHEE